VMKRKAKRRVHSPHDVVYPHSSSHNEKQTLTPIELRPAMTRWQSSGYLILLFVIILDSWHHRDGSNKEPKLPDGLQVDIATFHVFDSDLWLSPYAASSRYNLH
jgi:hypothetical protein